MSEIRTNVGLIVYLADKNLNKFMECMDMKSVGKFFIKKVSICYVTNTPVNSDYFFDLIKKSKNNKDFWIPAIEYNKYLYVDKEVSELSDGIHILYSNYYNNTSV